jgi:predicted enzyme related to lactoylglutathione lyase
VTRDASFISGSVCWADVSSTDLAASPEFYTGLFGWTYEIDSYPGREQHLTALCGGRPVAGLSGVGVQAGHPVAWTLYLASSNVMRTAQVLRRWGAGCCWGGPDRRCDRFLAARTAGDVSQDRSWVAVLG